MPRSASNLFLLSALGAAVIALLLTAAAAGRVVLTGQKQAIEQTLTRAFGLPVRIGKLEYVPPLSVVLRDVDVAYAVPAAGPLLQAGRVDLELSAVALFKERRFAVGRIRMIGPRIDMGGQPQALLAQVRAGISRLAETAHGPMMGLSMEEARIITAQPDAARSAAVVSLRVNLRARQRLNASGTVSFAEQSAASVLKKHLRNRPREELMFRLAGTMAPEGVIINELQVRQGNGRVFCRGTLRGDSLVLSGSGRVDNYYYDKRLLIPGQKKITLSGLIDLVSGRVPREAGLADLALKDVNIHLKFKPDGITIEQAAVIIGDIPARVRGDVTMSDDIRLRLQAGIFPDAREGTPEYARRVDAGLEGVLQAGAFSGEVWGCVVNRDDVLWQKHLARATVQKASLRAGSGRRVLLDAPNADITVQIGGDHQALFLTDVRSAVSLADMPSWEATFAAGLFDGEVKARAYLDRRRRPAGAGVDLTVRGVSAHQLDELLLSLFGTYRRLPVRLPVERVTGMFDTDVHFAGLPQPELEGTMTITNGTLKSVRFGVWMADFFDLAVLRDLEFIRLSSAFRVSEDRVDIQEIALGSAAAKISGTMRLEKSEWLSGMLTLVVPVKVLEESRKFQRLVSLLGGELSELEFSFQLSGLYKMPNFKWQESVFKQKLQQRLPGFVERGIERKVEQAMRGISGG